MTELMKKLEVAIQVNKKEGHPLKRATRNLSVTEEFVAEALKISNSAHDLPLFFSKLIFFQKNYDLQSEKLYSMPDKFALHCEQELQWVKRFFDQHRNSLAHSLLADVNTNSLLASMVLSYGQYAALLKNELHPADLPLPASEAPLFKVDASATDIIELVLAFHAKGLFKVGGGEATQKWLIEWAERTFGIPLKNWEQVAVNIRNRKSAGVKFLEELTTSLNSRFDRILLGKQYQRRLKNK